MANIIKIADFSDEALDFYAREKEAQLKHQIGRASCRERV